MRNLQARSNVNADIVQAILLQPFMTWAMAVASEIGPDLAEALLIMMNSLSPLMLEEKKLPK